MPRAGLSTERVTAEAAVLADEVGYDGLTLTVLAERLGVAIPSLYKHVPSLEALRIGVAVLALEELGAGMQAAVADARSERGRSPLLALAHAYRGYATKHPGRYAATMRAAAPTHAEVTAASTLAMETAYSVLADIDLEGGEAIDAARAVRAALHGFVSLEAAGGFGLPQDIDGSFERMLEALEIGLGAMGRRHEAVGGSS